MSQYKGENASHLLNNFFEAEIKQYAQNRDWKISQYSNFAGLQLH